MGPGPRPRALDPGPARTQGLGPARALGPGSGLRVIQGIVEIEGHTTWGEPCALGPGSGERWFQKSKMKNEKSKNEKIND